jgi:hypothetical protein
LGQSGLLAGAKLELSQRGEAGRERGSFSFFFLFSEFYFQIHFQAQFKTF